MIILLYLLSFIICTAANDDDLPHNCHWSNTEGVAVCADIPDKLISSRFNTVFLYSPFNYVILQQCLGSRTSTERL